jgi:hypothetical protein
MKYFKSFFITLAILFLSSCNMDLNNGNSAPHPDFKIGQKGIEKMLKQDFDFQKMSVGTHMKTKMGTKEFGLNLTFQKDDMLPVSDNTFKEHASTIKKLVVNNLLHLEDYDFINITFENENIEGEFTKSTSVKIRKLLK